MNAGVESTCELGASRRDVAEVLFGRNIGDRVGVGEAEFQAFLNEAVTPRFPGGFTVIDTFGQYRSAGPNSGPGIIVREPGKLLLIALDGTGDDGQRVRAIANDYKQRFHQESVGIIVRTACVSF
jgi:hypothetical protein